MFNESNLLYRSKNYEIDKDIFSEKNVSYDDKFMYELYYNTEKDLVLVCIQTEYFSLSSIEPIYLYEDYEANDNKYIQYLGSGKDFYDVCVNRLDIKMKCRHIDEFDIDYDQVSKIYDLFIGYYKNYKPYKN